MGLGFDTKCTSCGYENYVTVGIGMLASNFGDYFDSNLGRCTTCGVVDSVPVHLTRYRCACGHSERGSRILLRSCAACGRAWETADVIARLKASPNAHPSCLHCGGEMQLIETFPGLSTCPQCGRPSLEMVGTALWD